MTGIGAYALSFLPAPTYTVYFDRSGTVSFADPVPSRFGRLQMYNEGVSRTLRSGISLAEGIFINSDNGVIVIGGTKSGPGALVGGCVVP